MVKLYCFNPEHDLALANGNENFQAPESIVSLADDLSLLPCWYADEGSLVLSDQTFEKKANVLGLKVRIFKPFSSASLADVVGEPWGWDLTVRKTFLQNGIDAELLPSVERIENYKRLSHRRLASRAMDYLRGHTTFPEALPSAAKEITDLKELQAFVAHHAKVVLKAPWSSSGNGVFWVSKQLTPSMTGWCRRVIGKQGSVMAEVAMERVQDFAMEFKVKHDKVEFAGYSLFETEGSGIYRGNRLMSNSGIEQIITQWVHVEHLLWIKETLIRFLEENLVGSYVGYVGVDMFVYRDGDEMKINPAVELNLRMTMGMVARIIADKYLAAGKTGWFLIDHLPPGQLLADHENRECENRAVIENGKIVHGYLSLCPIFENTVYRASVVVE